MYGSKSYVLKGIALWELVVSKSIWELLGDSAISGFLVDVSSSTSEFIVVEIPQCGQKLLSIGIALLHL